MDFKQVYTKDIFANETGVVLDKLDDDSAIMSIVVKQNHLNAGNVAHGAVIFLLADITMAAMANHKTPCSVSIQSDIRFLAGALEGDKLTAEAVEVFGRKSLFNCRVTVTNQKGEMIAIAEGMFHTKRNFNPEK
ncbi:MAG: PaaI family thioesterase [Rikenellaceae bacterium]